PCSSTHPSNLISIYLSANLLIVISPKENKKCLAVVETVAVVLAASAAAAAAGTLRGPRWDSEPRAAASVDQTASATLVTVNEDYET
ncbi:hypothetical protein CICLE_v10029803mg, partial [Citrus x clementina]